MRTSSSKKTEGWRSTERRKEQRFTLILRAGILEQGGKSSLCIVRNVSSAGVQVKLYSTPVLDAKATIRVADELPVSGRIAWINDDVAGITFDEELDAPTLLRVQQRIRPKRRRALPRMLVDSTATVQCGGRTCRAKVRDISSLGTRVATLRPLAVGNTAMVTFPELPAIKAYVRWCDEDEAGLVFETPIPMQIIARWLDSQVRVIG